MPGTYITPMTWNRRWWIDLSANDSPQWAEVSVGITSRGNSINEQSQEYYDMTGRADSGHGPAKPRHFDLIGGHGPANPRSTRADGARSREPAVIPHGRRAWPREPIAFPSLPRGGRAADG